MSNMSENVQKFILVTPPLFGKARTSLKFAWKKLLYWKSFQSCRNGNIPLSWFNPGQQLSLTQPLAHSLHSGIGERMGRPTGRNLMGWDKGSLTDKAKAACTSEAKEGIHSPLPISRQVFNRLQESTDPSCLTVTWEDKCYNYKCPCFILLPSPNIYCWAYIIWHGISFWSVGASCPSCFPSQPLVHPQSTCSCCGVRNRKDLDYV